MILLQAQNSSNIIEYISIGLIIFSNIIIVIWGAAKITSKLEDLINKFEKLERKFDGLDCIVADHETKITVIAANTKTYFPFESHHA